MLPLILKTDQGRVVVIGRGLAAQQRYELVREAGIERISLYVIDQDGWACHAEAALYERLPVRQDLEGAIVAFIAGLETEETARMAAIAREAGALVNIHDKPSLCDFYVPAVVRRGALMIAVSTGGLAPRLAQRIRSHLGKRFGPEWKERLQSVAEARQRRREEGSGPDEIARLIDSLVDGEGWLREPERA
jgi:precorrin-2 dehydrogenase/sirohydrochlorin ferrochelatase